MSSSSSSTTPKDNFTMPIENPCSMSLEEAMEDYSSNNLGQTRNDFPTIFKVPNIIRSHDPKAYEPVIVSLGPYHHSCSREQFQLKLYYLNKFLQRNSTHCLNDYIQMIKSKEMEARTAYSEQVNMSSDYFVRMMLLDCCFVLEIINSIHRVRLAEEKHRVVDKDIEVELLVNPILSIGSSRLMLLGDILLLENQLPFFLLKHLFDCVYENDDFLSWVLSVFCFPANWEWNPDYRGEVYHLLHLLHSIIAPPAPSNQEEAKRSPKDLMHGYLYNCACITPRPSLEGNQFEFFLSLISAVFICLLDELAGEYQLLEEVSDFLHLFHSVIAPPTPGITLGSTSKIEGARRSLWDIIRGHFYKVNSRSLPEDNVHVYCPSTLIEDNAHVHCPSAIRLREAGVNFVKSEETYFLCITFDKGKMKIPALDVDDYTNILFRNLIAFEQCYCKSVKTHDRYHHMGDEKKYVTAYASLMDCIINTEADVNLLQNKKIIIDGLGSGEEVARIFNNLCKGVVWDYQGGYLSNVFKSVNEHCNISSNKWKAKLNHDYLSSPWARISLCGALTLFLFTGAQTIYTILSYYK